MNNIQSLEENDGEEFETVTSASVSCDYLETGIEDYVKQVVEDAINDAYREIERTRDCSVDNRNVESCTYHEPFNCCIDKCCHSNVDMVTTSISDNISHIETADGIKTSELSILTENPGLQSFVDKIVKDIMVEAAEEIKSETELSILAVSSGLHSFVDKFVEDILVKAAEQLKASKNVDVVDNNEIESERNVDSIGKFESDIDSDDKHIATCSAIDNNEIKIQNQVQEHDIMKSNNDPDDNCIATGSALSDYEVEIENEKHEDRVRIHKSDFHLEDKCIETSSAIDDNEVEIRRENHEDSISISESDILSDENEASFLMLFQTANSAKERRMHRSRVREMTFESTIINDVEGVRRELDKFNTDIWDKDLDIDKLFTEEGCHLGGQKQNQKSKSGKKRKKQQLKMIQHSNRKPSKRSKHYASSFQEITPEILPEVEAAFTCPVCLEMYYLATRCQPCDHIFCDPCLRRLTGQRSDGIPCPLCRAVISSCQLDEGFNELLKQNYPDIYTSRDTAEKNSKYRFNRLPFTARIPMGRRLLRQLIVNRNNQSNERWMSHDWFKFLLGCTAGVCLSILIMMYFKVRSIHDVRDVNIMFISFLVGAIVTYLVFKVCRI